MSALYFVLQIKLAIFNLPPSHQYTQTQPFTIGQIDHSNLPRGQIGGNIDIRSTAALL